MADISGKTKLLCVIGSPIEHSMSPAMHNEAIRLLGLDYVYTAFDVSEENTENAINSLKLLGAAGCNVTMPGKTKALQMADEATKVARLSGAANTIVFKNGKILADSTDGRGFTDSLRRQGEGVKGNTITILGAGGAARAIIAQCAVDEAAKVRIFRREGAAFKETERFADLLNKETKCNVTVTDIADAAALKAAIDESICLLNATNVGMHPDDTGCLIEDDDMLRSDLIVGDLVYNPEETVLLSKARNKGCRIITGKSVLLYQGAAAFEKFTGQMMPVDEVSKNVFGRDL